MGYKQDIAKKRTKSARQIAFAAKKKYEDKMKGKKTKLVPHPTIPKTFIEIIVE